METKEPSVPEQVRALSASSEVRLLTSGFKGATQELDDAMMAIRKETEINGAVACQ